MSDYGFIFDDDRRTAFRVLTDLIEMANKRGDHVAWHALGAARMVVGEYDRELRFGGSSGSTESNAAQHETTGERTQRVSTTNTAGANVDGGTPAERPCPGPSFSDPGDGYDSAIRHHADFERGYL